jgi:hypothetical protein
LYSAGTSKPLLAKHIRVKGAMPPYNLKNYTALVYFLC